MKKMLVVILSLLLAFSQTSIAAGEGTALRDEETLRLYAARMALQAWEAEETERALNEQLRDAFDEAFIRMGIENDTVRGELFRYAANQNSFGALLVSAQDGDLGKFAGKCGEIAGDAIIAAYYHDANLIKNLPKMGGTAIRGITNAAIKLSEGDGAQAAKEISIAFINYFPAGKAVMAAVEVGRAAVSSWKNDKMEISYRQFTQLLQTGAKELTPDDWASLSIKIDPYIRQLQSEQKDIWCRVNGISRAQLDGDAELSARIDRLTQDNLRKRFENRAAAEEELSARTETCRELILGFDRDGLLTQGSFGFDFGGSLDDRLASLNAIRANILGMVGGSMPYEMGEDPQRNLNAAIAEWLVRGPGDRAGFYEWMAAKGYIAPPEPQTELEAILDAYDPTLFDFDAMFQPEAPDQLPDWLTEDITEVPEIPGS